MKYRSFLSCTFLAILLAAGHLLAKAQEVSVALADHPVAQGSTVKGMLVLTIPDGLHVNSNKPSSEYLIATSVRLSGDGIKVGKITYPEGRNRKFQFSDSELNVYEGRITIPFSVSILKAFKGKRISMKARIRYQACTEEVCFPPKNKEITMTAEVK